MNAVLTLAKNKLYLCCYISGFFLRGNFITYVPDIGLPVLLIKTGNQNTAPLSKHAIVHRARSSVAMSERVNNERLHLKCLL